MRFTAAITCGLALVAGSTLAHPGHDVRQEAVERRTYLNSIKRASLNHCAGKLKARGVDDRAITRRAARVDSARQRRGLKKRDVSSVLATSHNETGLGCMPSTDEAAIFSTNNSCVLTPEVTVGPYYVSGEYIREDITDDQEGVDIVLDYQVIDVDTCEPVPDVYLEIWHCNSTGVYSGVVASSNGESSDYSNINKTFLRGIQQTDSDGVAQFESIFPGHYTGRATHIHVMVHSNVTVYENGTLGSENYASHVGQAFFDQDLISLVEAKFPYTSNTQNLTENVDDDILSEEADGVDPLMEYTFLGDAVGDGLFAWLSFGINTTLSDVVSPAASYYESGGVENDSSSGEGGGGGPPADN